MNGLSTAAHRLFRLFSVSPFPHVHRGRPAALRPTAISQCPHVLQSYATNVWSGADTWRVGPRPSADPEFTVAGLEPDFLEGVIIPINLPQLRVAGSEMHYTQTSTFGLCK